MRKCFTALCSILTLASFDLQAFFCCENWGCLDVQAEWLYLRPSKENIVFQTQTVASPNREITETTVIPSFHSGWRVKGSYLFCDSPSGISVSYTQLRTHDQREFSTGVAFLGAFVYTTPQAIEDYSFDYYAIEGLYSHRVYCACSLDLSVLAGVQYAWLGYKDDVQFPLLARSFINERAHFWGVGPEFGISFIYCFLPRFTLVGKVTGALIIGGVAADVFNSSALATAQQDIDRVWKVVPTWDARLGLRYAGQVTCLNYHLEAGFETISYLGSIQSVASDQVHADMFGPYVAAGVSF